MMSIEREYIKELLGELETAGELEKNYNNLVKKYDEELGYEAKLKRENDDLRKQIDDLKTKVKKPYTRTTITNPQTIDVFEALKDGDLITFIQPTENKKYNRYKSNPFIFRYDDKGAVFEGELLGVFEERKGNIYYYHQNMTKTRSMIGEIIRQVIGIDEETMDCKYKTKGSRGGKMVKEMSLKKILKLNPIRNIFQNKFVSNKYNEFIYTKQDGSQYIIHENGSEEII